jgi:thiamine biosynthesis lipoprotein
MSAKMLKTIWLALIGLAFLVSCTQQQDAEIQPVLLQGNTMGTTFSIKLFPSTEQLNKTNLYQMVTDELEHVNQLMSTYIPDSELSRLNQVRAGEAFTLSADNLTVMNEALRVHEISQGAFDVTVGPLVNLWGFGPNGRVTKQPSEESIAEIRQWVGSDKFSLADKQIVKSHDKVYIDFSAIAKGYGVDKIADLLESQGITNYLVEIGGEMRLSGKKPDGKAWSVAVERPVVNRREAQLIFSPGENGMATSGDYRNYFEENGERFSHTIDPATSKPIKHKLASVTVLHPSAMSADALATAINVMGPVKGIEFAEKHKLAVYILIKTEDGFAEVLSSEFEQYAQKAH